MAANVRKALALFDEDLTNTGTVRGSKSQDSRNVFDTNKRHVKKRLQKSLKQEQQKIQSRKDDKRKKNRAIDLYHRNLPQDNTERNVQYLQKLSQIGKGVIKNTQQILEHHDPSWKTPPEVKEDQPIFDAEEFAAFEKEYFTT